VSRVAALLAGLAVLAACASGLPRRAEEDEPRRDAFTEERPERVTPTELDQLTRAFADRYVTLISDAAEDLKQAAETPRQRHEAHMLKLTGSTAAYDIATNPDPFTQLVDMVLLVTLQSVVWIDEGRAEAVFGEHADLLVVPLFQAREEVWELADRVMRPFEQEYLDNLIWNWRQLHQSVETVALIRFDDFAESRGKSLISDVRRGGGLLAPVGAATQAIDEARLMAERVFFIAKRAPMLLSWQVEAMTADVLRNPDLQRTLDSFETVAASMKETSDTIATLPEQLAEQRTALQEDLNEDASRIDDLLTKYREAVGETSSMVESVQGVADSSERIVTEVGATSEKLNATLAAVERIIERAGVGPGPKPSPAASGEPFDIEAYAAATAELGRTAERLNELVASTDSLLASEAWGARLDDVRTTASEQLVRVEGITREVVDRMFYRALLLAGAIFAMAVAYRCLAAWVIRPRAVVRQKGAQA